MKVDVYLTSAGDRSALDGDGRLELEEGASLDLALKRLKIPRSIAESLFISINGRGADYSRILKDGDSIAFVRIHVGG